jgi:competence protein ComEA
MTRKEKHMKSRTHHAVRLLAALVAVSLVLGTVALGQTPTSKANPASKDANGVKVNINQGDAEQLMTIKGIGPVMAKRIIEHREKNGPFKKVEDLLAVRGIGEKSLERLRSQIVL